MLRLLLVFLVVTLGLHLSVGEIVAQESFTTYLTATYTVNDQGETTVIKKFEITNNTSLHYISDYHITLGSTNITNVSAYSVDERVITTTTSKGDNSTTISLDFQKPVVGEGNTHAFSLEYLNSDITQKVGRVLEVNIPKLADTGGISSYTVELYVPREFGTPTTIAPQTKRISTDPAYTKLEYAHKQATNESISVIFGEYQMFDLSLRYNLENPTITPIITQIALPPDTPYQRMFYHQIQPPPNAIDLDADGNWIATYRLEPRVRTAITISATVQTFLVPTVPVRSPTADYNDYLRQNDYWQVEDPMIKELAKRLGSAKAIYDYLVEELEYNYRRIDNAGTSRLGAREILLNPKNALCLEFADAFIALARAAGIPARLNTGYAYTQNELLRPRSLLQEVLHAWPEYYDEVSDLWVPVDPTWGSTTGGIDYFNQMDYNHIVFAIHGLDSERPFPAGYYKSETSQGRDVFVNYNQDSAEAVLDFEVNHNPNMFYSWGLINRSSLVIRNLSNVAVYDYPISMVMGDRIITPLPDRLSVLPFSETVVNFTSPSILDSDSGDNLVIRLEDQEYTINVKRNIYGLFGLVIGIIAIGAVAFLIRYRS